MKRKNDVKNLALAGVFAAIITIFILFIRMPIPSTSGYVHLGDSIVYLSAYLLPWPFALAASAIGGGLADICVGAAVYAIPTAVVKALMAGVASFFFQKFQKTEGKVTVMGYFLAFGCGTVVLVGGYFLFERVQFGMAYAVSGVLFNLMQGVAGSILTLPMIGAAKALKKRK